MKPLFGLARVLLPVALLAPAADAQPLPVYSGDHDGFTRIVVALPGDATWSIETPEQRRHILTIDGSRQTFDLSDIYRRIGRNRLSEITPGDEAGRLVFETVCDCPPVVDTTVRGHIVLDFTPGYTPERTAMSSPVWLDRGIASVARNTAAESATRFLPDPGASQGAPRSPLAETLIRQFASSVAEGTLTASDPAGTEAALSALSEADPRTVPGTAAPEFGPGLPNRNVDCTAYDFLDVRRGSAPEEGFLRIAALRKELLDPNGHLDPDAQRDLAHAYLSFGLGQEALQLLAGYRGSDRGDLIDLARLVENGRIAPPGMALRLACGPSAHVWAILAQRTRASDVDPDAILGAFDVWPDPLRHRLGPGLANTLGEKRMEDAARRVLARLERNPEGPSDAARLEAIRLAEQPDNAALAELHVSPNEAVAIASVRARVQASTDVEDAADLATLTEALTREYRGTSDELTLASAHVEALAAAGAYQTAFDRLQNLPDAAEADRADLLARTLEAALADTDEIRVLAFLHGRLDQLAASTDLRDPERLEVAKRLTEGGFPDAAERLLSGVSSQRFAEDRRLALARAMLARGDPERAEIELIGLIGQEADNLRRHARELMGDFAFLDSQPDGTLPEATEHDAAVLSDNWSRLTADTESAWSDTATIMTATPIQIDPARLDGFEALAKDTEDFRRIIGTLLEDTRLSED